MQNSYSNFWNPVHGDSSINKNDPTVPRIYPPNGSNPNSLPQFKIYSFMNNQTVQQLFGSEINNRVMSVLADFSTFRSKKCCKHRIIIISEFHFVWVCIGRIHAITLDMLRLLHCVENSNECNVVWMEHLKFIRYY